MEERNSGALPSPRILPPISAEIARPSARRSDDLLDFELTHEVIGCFYRVHARMRDGYLEAVYVEALRLELLRAGLDVKKEAVLESGTRGRRSVTTAPIFSSRAD